MQKVIRRTLFAEKQVARRNAARAAKRAADQRRTDREGAVRNRKEEVLGIKTARAVQKEDYALGPLAPRRDIGIHKDTYGTISTLRMQGPKLTYEQRKKLDPDTGAKTKQNLVVNDRVVLLEGRDKGKIGRIVDINETAHQCTVEGLNLMEVPVPKYLRAAEGDPSPVRTLEEPVYLHKVRLVVPLPDPETGVMRDVIVKKLYSAGFYYDAVKDKRVWSRYIADLDIKVPWPEVKEPVYEAFNCDTLRQEVDNITYTPQLMKSPFPGSVLDELRNKYSVFRTRHEPEYVAAKIQEDKDKENQKKLAKSMRSPLREISRLRRKARKQQGKPRLSEAQKQRIAEVIERKQASAMEILAQRKKLLETTGRLQPLVPMHERWGRRKYPARDQQIDDGTPSVKTAVETL